MTGEAGTVGRCGDTLTTGVVYAVPRTVCALPFGHQGWHRADNGAEWSRDPGEEATPMTEKPYTDADVDLVAATFTAEAKKNPIDTSTPPWMPQTRLLLGPTEHDIARAVLDALAAAGRLAPADDDPRHIIEFRTDGWTIKHPLACRPQLFQCAVTHASGELDGPPVSPGRYEVSVSDIDGRLVIGDRADRAEREG